MTSSEVGCSLLAVGGGVGSLLDGVQVSSSLLLAGEESREESSEAGISLLVVGGGAGFLLVGVQVTSSLLLAGEESREESPEAGISLVEGGGGGWFFLPLLPFCLFFSCNSSCLTLSLTSIVILGMADAPHSVLEFIRMSALLLVMLTLSAICLCRGFRNLL